MQQDVWIDTKMVGHYGRQSELQAPEKAILRDLSYAAPFDAILDIGVGGGRTVPHLAALTAKYIGVDLSEEMLAACQRRFHGRPSIQFQRVDAVDLSQFSDGGFDFVMFSYNGIDCIADFNGRARCLEEIYRVCRGGGYFCFSVHNLQNWQRMFALLPTGESLLRLRRYLRQIGINHKNRKMNPGYKNLDQHNRVILNTSYGNHDLPLVFIRPRAQIEDLETIGFQLIAAYAQDGQKIDPERLESLGDAWVYFLCRKPAV